MSLNIEAIKHKIEDFNNWHQMFLAMKSEVIGFTSTFDDDPKRISGWGHHYFCKEDGSALIYNPKNSKEHKCPLCGAVYTDQVFSEVWTYRYRNEAVLTVYKAAVLYQLTKDEQYLSAFMKIVGFYMDNYDDFDLHDKEGNIYESIETMGWGCGRLMPQGLNESIAMIRLFAGATLIRHDLPEAFLMRLKEELVPKVYELLKPQVDKIHNISCWANSAIGTMGLFAGNEEIIKFAFEGDLNIRRQLREGVTKDGFWYEGSIHYNFFTLEGMTYLALMTQEYGYDFGEELKILENMLIAAYEYAFNSQRLPNPNDGWPDINLQTYTYIYSLGVKIFGYNSPVASIFNEIISKDVERGTVPLSKPYYYNNIISLEQFVYLPDFDSSKIKPVIEKKSKSFETSNFALLMKNDMNLFYKYGHNSPSHAHPDKMTFEVVAGDTVITRDLSNSGYCSRMCNEWHRMSASHNTVVVDGKNHVSVEPGELIAFKDNYVRAKAKEVYEGVEFERSLELNTNKFDDYFMVTSTKEHVYDYFMHIDGKLLTKGFDKEGSLDYIDNGYQHLLNVKNIPSSLIKEDGLLHIEWEVDDLVVEAIIDMKDTEGFICDSPDNPISKHRSTLILRKKMKQAEFKASYRIKKRS